MKVLFIRCFIHRYASCRNNDGPWITLLRKKAMHFKLRFHCLM